MPFLKTCLWPESYTDGSTRKPESGGSTHQGNGVTWKYFLLSIVLQITSYFKERLLIKHLREKYTLK